MGFKSKLFPGFIVHWDFSQRHNDESIWLIYYVNFWTRSSFRQFLNHGVRIRKIIEDGPPEENAKALHDLFVDKIATTKIACANSRTNMHWYANNLKFC